MNPTMVCTCIRDTSRITTVAVPDPDCPKHEEES